MELPREEFHEMVQHPMGDDDGFQGFAVVKGVFANYFQGFPQFHLV